MNIYLAQYSDDYGSFIFGVYEDKDKAIACAHQGAARELEHRPDPNTWDCEISVVAWDTETQKYYEVQVWQSISDIDPQYLLPPEQLFDVVIVDFEPWPTIQQRRTFFENRDKRKEDYRKIYETCIKAS